MDGVKPCDANNNAWMFGALSRLKIQMSSTLDPDSGLCGQPVWWPLRANSSYGTRTQLYRRLATRRGIETFVDNLLAAG